MGEVPLHKLLGCLLAQQRLGWFQKSMDSRKVDVRLPGKGDPNCHGARLVYSNHLDDEVDSDQ